MHEVNSVKNTAMTSLRETALKIRANFKINPNSQNAKFYKVSKLEMLNVFS